MGQAIVAVVNESPNLVLGSVWERAESPDIGTDYGTSGLTLAAGPESGQMDVAIDFTAPAATVQLARWCAENGTALVVGTTGLEHEHTSALDEAARVVPILQAPNMSVGVNVLCALVDQATRMLGHGWDLEVVETHHRNKKDAPSGTAMRLFNVLKDARAGSHGVFERHGMIGARTDEEIGVQTLRGGDVVGEHTVFYFGNGERIELSHRATDRAIFARGAVRAAVWLHGKAPGRYGMTDVLAAG